MELQSLRVYSELCCDKEESVTIFIETLERGAVNTIVSSNLFQDAERHE